MSCNNSNTVIVLNSCLLEVHHQKKPHVKRTQFNHFVTPSCILLVSNPPCTNWLFTCFVQTLLQGHFVVNPLLVKKIHPLTLDKQPGKTSSFAFSTSSFTICCSSMVRSTQVQQGNGGNVILKAVGPWNCLEKGIGNLKFNLKFDAIFLRFLFWILNEFFQIQIQIQIHNTIYLSIGKIYAHCWNMYHEYTAFMCNRPGLLMPLVMWERPMTMVRVEHVKKNMTQGKKTYIDRDVMTCLRTSETKDFRSWASNYPPAPSTQQTWDISIGFGYIIGFMICILLQEVFFATGVR